LNCTANDWILFWKKIYDRYGAFSIQVSGGEPFLYPDFSRLIKEISDWHEIEIITNLSWDIASTEGYDVSRISFSASFHPYFADYDEFSRKIASLRQDGFRVLVTIVAYPAVFDRMQEFKADFEAMGVGFIVVPFQGMYDGKPYPEAYSSQQKECLRQWRKEPKPMMDYALKETSPLGRPCASGMLYFRTYPDGQVYRCISAKDMPGGNSMGSIKDPDFALFSSPASCAASHCLCAVEYHNLGAVQE
jgi:MoaA/NifB/PqqE/SkfB family radical SAM enzyme